MCSTIFCTFLCLCFSRLQRETSRNVLVSFYEGNVVCVPVTCSPFFFALAHFYFGGRQHFSRFHRRYKFFMFFFPRNLSPFFISCVSSFSVLHVNGDIKTKNRLCCCYCLSLKVRVAMRFTPETLGCLKCKILPRLT